MPRKKKEKYLFYVLDDNGNGMLYEEYHRKVLENLARGEDPDTNMVSDDPLYLVVERTLPDGRQEMRRVTKAEKEAQEINEKNKTNPERG